jgi:hypothetical protein
VRQDFRRLLTALSAFRKLSGKTKKIFHCGLLTAHSHHLTIRHLKFQILDITFEISTLTRAAFNAKSCSAQSDRFAGINLIRKPTLLPRRDPYTRRGWRAQSYFQLRLRQ